MRAAYYLKLPASGPVPLPRIVERWTVPRSNFVHKKSQENFERITVRRLIQIKDGHPESVQLWLAFLRRHAFPGVGMKANVWEFDSLGMFSLRCPRTIPALLTIFASRCHQENGCHCRERQQDPGAVLCALWSTEGSQDEEVYG